jgi:hypothetical protein
MQSMQITELTRDLAKREKAGDYPAVIEGARELIGTDRSAFKDPWIKGWVGRRWRDLFMQEAVKDKDAVEYASKPPILAPVPLPGFLKNSNPRRAIAERFLKDAPASEWQAEMPAGQYDSIEHTTLICTPKRTRSRWKPSGCIRSGAGAPCARMCTRCARARRTRPTYWQPSAARASTPG